MFEGRRLDAALSCPVQDPESQSDHFLVVVAAHLCSHHLTKLGKVNVARVVRVELREGVKKRKNIVANK